MNALLPSTLSPVLLTALIAIFCLLTIASMIIYWQKANHPKANTDELVKRVNTWWYIALVFALILIASPKASLIILAFISFLAFKEYLSLIPTRRADGRVLFWAYLAIPLQYYWASTAWYGMFIIFIPVYIFLLLPLRMVLAGETEGFLRSAGIINWGLMTTVFSLSHLGYLLVLPQPESGLYTGATILLFLVVLTQLNDVAQYLWGKKFGHKKIVPSISPNKTWAGFLGGVFTTTLLSFLIAPYLTPLTRIESITAGIIIAMAGFIGDIVISAVKRDIGVKDSGNLLPGHGGLLDRLDSLTYTAPLFFHFIYFLHF
jgi:phosphatidate cytidylyltransferase